MSANMSARRRRRRKRWWSWRLRRRNPRPFVHVSPPVAAPPAYAAPVEVRVEPQSAPRVVVPAVPIFTLEDVDKKLQIAKANSRRLALETPPSSSSDTSEDGAAAGASEVGVRPLEEVIDVFEKRPAPAQRVACAAQ